MAAIAALCRERQGDDAEEVIDCYRRCVAKTAEDLGLEAAASWLDECLGRLREEVKVVQSGAEESGGQSSIQPSPFGNVTDITGYMLMRDLRVPSNSELEGQARSSTGRAIEEAARHFHNGRRDAAEMVLREAIALHGGDGPLHESLGECLLTMGRIDEAKHELREALRCKLPRKMAYAAHCCSAHAELVHRNFEPALQAVDHALDLYPEDEAALALRGYIVEESTRSNQSEVVESRRKATRERKKRLAELRKAILSGKP
jgi:tetratricopeptide (TPR) repeat protein